MCGSPEESLRALLARSELTDIVAEFGDVAIDTFLQDGTLKDLPLIGPLFAFARTVGSVRDYFFAKKLLLFLRSISNIPVAERAQLVQKMDEDPNFSRSAGAVLVELLTRLDGDLKPLYVATAFKLYARGEFGSTELLHINNAVERFLFCGLNELRAICSGEVPKTGSSPVLANMVNAGLAYVSSGYGAGGIHPTDIAPLLIRIVDETQE